MNEPAQARPSLSAVPHDERIRALARYKIIQPHVDKGVPWPPLSTSRASRCGPRSGGSPGIATMA
jgi:hypothetical protein